MLVIPVPFHFDVVNGYGWPGFSSLLKLVLYMWWLDPLVIQPCVVADIKVDQG